MYATLLMVHSLLRWLVLLALASRAGAGLIGGFGGSPWGGAQRGLGLATVIATDLQLLLGVGLYVTSPVVASALADPGAAMGDRVLRFWLVEHPVTMLLAVVAVHVGQVLTKRAKTDRDRHRFAAGSALVALLLVLAAIPWGFRGL